MERSSPTRAAVVLAAGKGTRMKSDLPKVAVSVYGKPMILHVLENLSGAGIRKIILVVGHQKEVVMDIVKDVRDVDIEFAVQAEQLGTGHALLCAKEALESFDGNILVACGDMPLIRAETFASLLHDHEEKNRHTTVLSSVLENPKGYGRIIRDEGGNLTAIVEEKDATDEIREIKETNTGTYVFRSPEIFEILDKIGSDNAQGEYYLPDAIEIFRSRGGQVGALILEDSIEALGANSKEDVEQLERCLAGR